jgi:hypothetical protein
MARMPSHRGDSAPERRPAGFCEGPGHVLRYGNPAFVARFAGAQLGMPAREALSSLPGSVFEVFDRVYREGRPLASWVELPSRPGEPHEPWRLTVVPRRDPAVGGVYGVTFHLRARSDVPVVATR